MATRSAIGIVHEGKILAVYCHWDGYPEHNGKILMQHYRDPELALQLVRMGDISSLGPKIGEKHPFDDWAVSEADKKLIARAEAEGWTKFYGRDRGEWSVDAETFDTVEEFVDHYSASEYFYLLKDGVWCVKEYEGSWITVENYLKEAE